MSTTPSCFASHVGIMSLSAEQRYLLTVVAFWPTTAYIRSYAYWFPHHRRIWDRVYAHVLLGAAPLFRREVEVLHRTEGVRGVINMCREWDGHAQWYPHVGIAQLRLPTIDFDVPDFVDCLAGAQFVRDHVRRGDSVYVHCKGGKGRSTTVVLAYLVLYCGMTPAEADAQIRRSRSHVSRDRWSSTTVQRVFALAQLHRPTIEAGGDVPEAVRALAEKRMDAMMPRAPAVV